MSLDALIREGRALVETTHKRCPVGTHWNDVHHKCEPLLPDQSLRQNRTELGSKAATAASHQAKKSGLANDHAYAAHLHDHAAYVHHLHAQSLERTGFRTLAAKHQKQSDLHSRHLERHKAKAGSSLDKYHSQAPHWSW